MSQPRSDLQVHPLTPEQWPDLETLLGPRGAVGGCWCMYWRLTRAAYNRNRGETNRQAFKELVEAGDPPGLLAYAGGEPVGWCALGPRGSYAALERSRTLARVDDQPVWSITCFFIAKSHRRAGVMTELLRAAIDYARAHGATIVEGYPVDPRRPDYPPAFAYTGLVPTFTRAGFVEVVRRSRAQPVMRLALAPAPR